MAEQRVAGFHAAERDRDRRVQAEIAGGIGDGTVGNRLLRLFNSDDFALPQPHLERVPLAAGQDLARAGQPIDSVCFLECGVAGYLKRWGNGRPLTVGLVGR